MILSAYETTLLKGRRMDAILQEVKQEIIRGNLKKLNYENHYGDVMAIAEKSSIPPFNYPLIIELDGRDPIAVVDLRLHARGFRIQYDQIDILKYSTADNIALAAVIALKWKYGGDKDIMAFSQVPSLIYAAWLSETISRKLGLQADSQVYLQVVFSAFYFCRNKTEFTRETKDRLAVILSRQFRLSPDQFTSILERVELKDLESLPALIQFFRQDKMNAKLENLQLKDIYSLASYGWFGGPDAREHVDVSLEYVPLFISMVHQAVLNRSYAKTPLSQVYQRYQQTHKPVDFERDFIRLIRG